MPVAWQRLLFVHYKGSGSLWCVANCMLEAPTRNASICYAFSIREKNNMRKLLPGLQPWRY